VELRDPHVELVPFSFGAGLPAANRPDDGARSPNTIASAGIDDASRADHHDRSRQAQRQPCTRDLRIPVDDVLGYLAAGMTKGEILADFPDLTETDIEACLAYSGDTR
jgi:Protein of unknown function (DUF433)